MKLIVDLIQICRPSGYCMVCQAQAAGRGGTVGGAGNGHPRRAPTECNHKPCSTPAPLCSADPGIRQHKIFLYPLSALLSALLTSTCSKLALYIFDTANFPGGLRVFRFQLYTHYSVVLRGRQGRCLTLRVALSRQFVGNHCFGFGLFGGHGPIRICLIPQRFSK